MDKGNIEFQQIGGNRGGRAFKKSFDDEIKDSSKLRSVEIVDLDLNRAEALAESYQKSGIPAVGSEGPPNLSHTPSVRVTAIDDAPETLRILQGSKKVPLHATGLVVSSDINGRLGGIVFSLEETLAAGDKRTQLDAEILDERIAWLSPTRETSQNLTAPLLNEGSALFARSAMHSHFARQTNNFIEGKQVQSEISVFDSQSGDRHRIYLLEVPRQESRLRLKRASTREILPSVKETSNLAGIAFYSKEDPWIYFVLAKFYHGRWVFRRAIELPVQRPPVVRIQVQDERDLQPKALTRRIEASRVYITD